MNKIVCKVNRETNYVFHILSVARCGYNNEYGAKFRPMYSEDDLAILKNLETDLTVCGGEHCGELIWIVAGLCFSENVGELCSKSLKQVEENTFSISAYTPERKEDVTAILKIFGKYYNRYINEIWPQEKGPIEQYAMQINKGFADIDFAEKAEQLVGCKADMTFHPSFVCSIQGGAEAIFIEDQDNIFCSNRDLNSALSFIGHEYMIFLLQKAIPPNENDWMNNQLYSIREGLAEFYLRKLLNKNISFEQNRNYIDFLGLKIKLCKRIIHKNFDNTVNATK